MYNISAPVLYKDCVTDEFPSFAVGLRTNENTDHTVRLHINHQRHWYEDTYHDILTIENYGWHLMSPMLYPGHTPLAVDLRSVERERHALVAEGRRIRQFNTEGLSILPRLRVVSMGGICGDIYNDPSAPALEHQLHPEFGKKCKILPHALLDLPSVQHYCQAVAYGPLSLPNRIIKPETPIISYTQHNRGAPMLVPCRHCFRTHLPPIILGATNRYYCDTSHIVSSAINLNHHLAALGSLSPILAMFNRPDIIVADPDTGEPIPLGSRIGSKMYKGTTVEIYNFIRVVKIGFLTIFDNAEAERGKSNMFGSRPPQSLSFFQEYLDRALPEIWRGKVKLMNREEAPDCEACGFSPRDEFESRDMSNPGFTTGNCPLDLFVRREGGV